MQKTYARFKARYNRMVEYEGPQLNFLYISLQDDTSLKVRREPNNKFDPGAIAVKNGNSKLGYFSRSEIKVLSHLMDAGSAFHSIGARRWDRAHLRNGSR